MRVVAMCLLGAWFAAAQAVVENHDVLPEEFASLEQRERFKELIKDLRCTVCQNQNLADSHAPLAKDLRRKILSLMQAGESDQQIQQFLVARYGDFVLYNPPLKRSTYLLWFMPFIAMVVAITVLLLLIRKRRTHSARLDPAAKQSLADALRKTARDRSNHHPS